MQEMQQAPQEGAPEAQAPGSVTELITNIHTGLVKLQDLFNATKAITPEDKQRLASVIQGYQSVVEDLGRSPGQQAPQQQQPGAGIAPAMAGAANVQPAM